MGMYVDAPDPPNYDKMANTQKAVAVKQLKFQKQQFRWAKQEAARLAQIEGPVIEQLLQQATSDYEFAQRQREHYEGVYQPLSYQELVKDIQRRDEEYGVQQEITRRTLAEQERQTGIAIEDREFYENEARPLQMELIQEERERQARDDANRNEVIQTGLEEQKRLQELSKADRQRYEENYLPYEEEFAQQLREYDSPGRREQESAAAISEVGQSFEAERAAAERRLAGFGIDPSMMRSGAMDLQSRIAEATAGAQAGTEARRGVEDRGREAGAMAVQLGRGAEEMSARNTQLSTGSGALAAGASVGGNASADNVAGQALGSAGAASGLIGQAGQLASGLASSGNYNPFAAGAQTAGLAGQAGAAGTGGGATALSSLQSSLGQRSAVRNAPVGYGNAAVSGLAGASNTMIGGYQAELAGAQMEAQYGPASLLTSGLGLIGGLGMGGAFSKGGALAGFQEGGTVPKEMSPSGGAVPDDTAIRASAGEHVVPDDVVRWKGEEFFYKLTDQARQARATKQKAIPT